MQFIAEVLGKLASLALYAVVARVGGTSEFGNLIFALSLSSLATAVGAFGIDGLLVRRVARDRAVAGRTLSNAIGLRLAFGAVGIAAALAVTFITAYSPDVRVAVAALTIASTTDLIAKGYYAVFQGLDDMRPMAGCLLIQRWLTASLGIVLALAGARIAVLALAFLAGSVSALVVATVWLARRGVSPERWPSPAGARDLARESFNLGASEVFTTVLFRADATMLSLYKGNSAVGLYGAAYRLLESSLFLTYDFALAILPTLSRLRRDTVPSVGRAFESGCKVIALLMVPVGDVMVAFPRPIVHLVYGSRYEAADTVMRLLGGATVTYGLAYLASFLLMAQDRDRVLPWTHAAVMLENIALNVILIPPLSYKGAAISTTASEATRTVILTWYAVRATGRIRVGRILLAPAVGTAGMVAVALGLGTSLASVALAVLVYICCVLAVEKLAFPDDLRFVRRAVARRSPASGAPPAE